MTTPPAPDRGLSGRREVVPASAEHETEFRRIYDLRADLKGDPYWQVAYEHAAKYMLYPDELAAVGPALVVRGHGLAPTPPAGPVPGPEQIPGPTGGEAGKCEACYATGPDRVRIRVINGGLLLCRNCLAQINGKSPLLAAAERRAADLAATHAFAERYRAQFIELAGMTGDAHWGDILVVLSAKWSKDRIQLTDLAARLAAVTANPHSLAAQLLLAKNMIEDLEAARDAAVAGRLREAAAEGRDALAYCIAWIESGQPFPADAIPTVTQSFGVLDAALLAGPEIPLADRDADRSQ